MAEDTAASDHYPPCLQQPAGAPASPRLKHKPNSQDRPACVFLGNSFLQNPAVRHLFFAAVQLRGRAHAEVLEEQSFPCPLAGALFTRCPCRTGAILALAGTCACHVPGHPSPGVPSCILFKELNCSSSRAGAQNIFPDRFSKEMSGEDSSPPAVQCLRQTLTSTISLFMISHNEQALEGHGSFLFADYKGGPQ